MAWLKEATDRPQYIETPNDLLKIGVSTPDRQRLTLDHLMCGPEQARNGAQQVLVHDLSSSVSKSLAIFSTDVCLLKGKLLSIDSIEECKKYDIFCMCETRCDDVGMYDLNICMANLFLYCIEKYMC